MSINFNELDISSWFPKDFSFIKSALSLAPFQSVMETVLVCGSYSIVALVLPWILNLILSPFGYSLILMGSLAIGAGLFEYFSQNDTGGEFWNNQILAGQMMFGFGVLLSFASSLAPLFILGIGIYRAYCSSSTSLLEDITAPVNDLTSNFSILDNVTSQVNDLTRRYF